MKNILITLREDPVSGYEETRDTLDQAWTDLLQEIGFVPIYMPNKIKDVKSYLKQFDIHGIILSGGNDLSYLENAKNISKDRDQTEQEIISYATAKDIPVLGICRGMQHLAYLAKSQLHKIEGHVGKPHGLQKIKDTNLFPQEFTVNSYHTYGVKEVPQDYICLAQTEDGFCEAMKHKDQKIFAIMWHPERRPRVDFNLKLIKQVFGEGQ